MQFTPPPFDASRDPSEIAAEKAHWEGQKRKAEVLQLSDVLVQRQVIAKEYGDRLAGLRNALLSIPPRLAPELAGVGRELIEERLREELTRALAGASDERSS